MLWLRAKSKFLGLEPQAGSRHRNALSPSLKWAGPEGRDDSEGPGIRELIACEECPSHLQAHGHGQPGSGSGFRLPSSAVAAQAGLISHRPLGSDRE